ncbi:MAG: metal-dependent hydrolase [Candidatus Bilamarchaeaceae archaeon]
MDWKVHLAFGFLLFIPVAALLLHSDFQQMLVLCLFSAFSALVPDLDHKEGKLKDILDKAVIFIAFAAVWALLPGLVPHQLALYAFAIAGAYFVLYAFFKPAHRGVTHSLVFTAVYSGAVFLLLGSQFASAGLVGCLSHLLADGEFKFM